MIKKELTVDEYFDDPVNTTMINERCIELTLGLRYIEKVGNDKLTEVGCVMPFYGYCEHPIIDFLLRDALTPEFGGEYGHFSTADNLSGDCIVASLLTRFQCLCGRTISEAAPPWFNTSFRTSFFVPPLLSNLLYHTIQGHLLGLARFMI